MYNIKLYDMYDTRPGIKLSQRGNTCQELIEESTEIYRSG